MNLRFYVDPETWERICDLQRTSCVENPYSLIEDASVGKESDETT